MVFASQYYICNRCRFRTTLFSRIHNHLLIHHDTKQYSPLSCFDTLKPLKCTSCDFSTESLVLLRYHLVHNHDQQQFTLKTKLKKCKKCGFCTHSNYLWIRHPICGTCKGKKGSKAEKKKVFTVSMKNNEKWHLCEKCDYRTVKLHNFKNHVIYKHTPLEEINWRQCKKCQAKFKTLNGLKAHQKYVHGSAVDLLNCTECDYSTPLRQSLDRHFNSKHARPEEIKWAECQECGAKFKEKQKLKLHLVRHTTKEKQFKCDECPFETHRRGALKRHIVRHLKDEDIKWYDCQHCNYKAKMKRNLKSHIQNMHSESVELVQCPHCSYKTKRDSNLRMHITRIHDDSTFKCDLSNYRVKSENTVEINKKNKHENSCDVKLLKCEHCDYNSKNKKYLKRHFLNKHNIDGEVLDCKECDYKTHSKLYLTKHITRMHKQQKFICEDCSFVTKTKQQLQRHISNRHTVHTEELKLNCPHCIYFCFNKKYLSEHLILKHKIGH